MKMLLRFWLRSLRQRRNIFVALTVFTAATTISALLILYADLDAKLNREFRRFGANLVIVAPSNAGIDVAAVRSQLSASDQAVPYAYVVARTADRQPVVVAGTDIAAALRMNPAWKVEGAGNALIGRRALAALGTGPLSLSFKGQALAIDTQRVLTTGGPEDSRIYLPLETLSGWTQVPISTIEVSIAGPATEVEAARQRLQAALPRLEVRPVRQVLESEVRVLNKTKSTMFASGIVIAALVLLALGAALSGSVLERRRDFALMRALGSSRLALSSIFLAETLALSGAMAIVGYFAGGAIASWITRVNFHASTALRWEPLPLVIATTIVVALLASIVPLWRLQKLTPAVILKGE